MQNELYIVADAIKALRESRGLTQEQLAEKADISVSHLAKIETHARLMGMKTYIRLLEAMDIPIKEHFIHMGTAKKDMMLKEKIWYLVQDCDERETNLLIYSIEGIVAFTTLPLSIAAYLGLIFCLVAFFMVLVVIAKTLMFGDPVGGWPSLACIILFVGGIQLLCAGIVGKYLAKIYLEVKHRPLYLVAEDNLKDDLREKGEE